MGPLGCLFRRVPDAFCLPLPAFGKQADTPLPGLSLLVGIHKIAIILSEKSLGIIFTAVKQAFSAELAFPFEQQHSADHQGNSGKFLPAKGETVSVE